MGLDVEGHITEDITESLNKLKKVCVKCLQTFLSD